MTNKIELPALVKPVTLPTEAGWWVGADDEYLNIAGPLPTREIAIAEGKAHQGDDPFYICYTAVSGWTAPCADTVMENWCEDADELFYEDGFSGFVGANGKSDQLLAREAENDLQTILNAWMERHKAMLPGGTTFSGTQHGEWIGRTVDDPSEQPAKTIDAEG